MAPLSSSRCAGLLAAACDDAATMTAAPFAEVGFAGLSNSMAPAAHFLAPCNSTPHWATDIMLAATGAQEVCCSELLQMGRCFLCRPVAVGSLQCGLFLWRQRRVTLDCLHSSLPALATPSVSTPLLAPWRISQREKPRALKSAHIEGMAVRTGTARCEAHGAYALWRQRSELLWIRFCPHAYRALNFLVYGGMCLVNCYRMKS